jgi:hypothetical protein
MNDTAPSDRVRTLVLRAIRHLECSWIPGRAISLTRVFEDDTQMLRLRNDVLGETTRSATSEWNAMVKWLKAQKDVREERPVLQIHDNLLQAFCRTFSEDKDAEAQRTVLLRFLVAIETDRDLCPNAYSAPVVSALERSPDWNAFQGEVHRALPGLSEVELGDLTLFHDWLGVYLGLAQDLAESA